MYDEETENFFASTIPGFFPDITHGHCAQDVYALPSLNGLTFIEGLLPGVQLGSSALAGFPSMQTLPHAAQLAYHGVNVHNSDSKNPSMVITIENSWEGKKTEEAAEVMLGKKVFSGWPFLREGLVVGISDLHFRYERTKMGGQGKFISTPHSVGDLGQFKRKAERIEHFYSKRFGIITGEVGVLLHVLPLKGSCLPLAFTKSLRRSAHTLLIHRKQTSSGWIPVPLSRITRSRATRWISRSSSPSQRSSLRTSASSCVALARSCSADEADPSHLLPVLQERVAPKLSDEFPVGERVFFLGDVLYGSAAQVKGTSESNVSVGLAVRHLHDLSPLRAVDAEDATSAPPAVLPQRPEGARPLPARRRVALGRQLPRLVRGGPAARCLWPRPLASDLEPARPDIGRSQDQHWPEPQV